ncbi:hypothetical protein BJP36_41060 [Moorena producens JHB]|uniref:Uncharacterized protein n=1 Tax=Moorena producens (strain JHB) TaxID=1454205 RepID=A0A9Q9SSD7_MOOP1|nr:hypothetical protein [Moorena producens]WAN68757.1 hypothetical protein BJP36_41060 [Moorena producens JHB]
MSINKRFCRHKKKKILPNNYWYYKWIVIIFIPYSLLPTPYSLLPTPYSLLPDPLFPLLYTNRVTIFKPP